MSSQAQSLLSASTTVTTASKQHQQHQLPAASFKLINSNHHVQSLENGSLSVRQANKEHEGYYMCEADNSIEPNLIKVIKLIVHLQAQFADDIQVSVSNNNNESNLNNLIASNLNNKQPSSLIATAPATTSTTTTTTTTQMIKTVKLAQNTTQLKLLCQPFGDLPLTLEWLKDGQLIYTHSSGPAAASSSSNNHHLSIESGPSSSGPLNSIQGLQYQAGEYVNRFHVNTRRSHQRPLIGLESELIIVNLRRLDAGLYTCLAKNSFGSSEKKLRLIVQEPPEAPEVVDVAHIGSRTISLRWLAPSFDGNSQITKYIVEYKRHSSSSLGKYFFLSSK